MKIPLLHDHHSHPLLYAAFRKAVDLSEIKSFEAAADLLVDNQREAEYGIALGFAWKDNFFAIDTTQLESLPPCAIFNLSLHKLLINQAAKQLLLDIVGNEIEKVADADWYERNLRTVLNWFAKLGSSPDALVSFYDYLQSVGVESAEEMLLIDSDEIDLYQSTGLTDRTKFWAAPSTFEQLSEEHRAAVAGFKLFTDGALGAWTAAISQPYPGLEQSSHPLGMLLYTDSELEQTLNDCVHRATEVPGDRKGIAIHAIGDRAIEQTLKTIEQMPESLRNNFSIIRIEHAQLITLEQARRAKDLNVVLSMQPNFSIDSVDYSDRLPTGFPVLNNPFRMLIDDVGFEPGNDLIFGSDGMPHGVQYATEQAFSPAFETQVLTRDEFVAGYTRCGQFDR